MPTRQQKKSDDGVRRFLADLRSGFDRRIRPSQRIVDRRSGPYPVNLERRTGVDRRRNADRRLHGERRLPLGEQFSLDDSIQLHAMLARPDGGVACPQCDGNLMLGPPDPLEGASVQEVHCTNCRRHAALVSEP